jgi:hypothetical protein
MLRVLPRGGRVAVPGLAAGALPEVLLGLEAAGGAAVAHQRLGRRGPARAARGVELLVLQLLAGDPLGRRDQRRLALQVLHVPGAPLPGRLQADQMPPARRAKAPGVAGAQHGARLLLGAAGRVFRERARQQRHAGRPLGQLHQRGEGAWRASPARRCSAASSIDGRGAAGGAPSWPAAPALRSAAVGGLARPARTGSAPAAGEAALARRLQLAAISSAFFQSRERS